MKPLLGRRTPCLLALVVPWSGLSLCLSYFQSRTQHRIRYGRDGSNAGGSIRESVSISSALRLSPIDSEYGEAGEAGDLNDLSGDAVEGEESGASSSNTTKLLADTPPHFINRESTVGIGGSTGVVYDVNKLKRNLVQESVRGCKDELLFLLGSGRQDEKSTTRTDSDTAPRWRRDRDDFIEERLAALVQANPVSTTTDSNLLDGSWSFAFKSHSASTILDTSRFLLSKTKRPLNTSFASKDPSSASKGGPWRFRTGKTENPFRSSTRQINLENLSANENAHVIDQNRILGGLFQSTRRYDVYGLTRTALDLDLAEIETRIFGICSSFKSRKDIAGTDLGQPIEIQVLYLDSDLCVTTSGIGLSGPLHVYTKSEEWVSGGAKRKVRSSSVCFAFDSNSSSHFRSDEVDR